MDFFRTVSNFIFGMECLGCGNSSERLDPWLCPACAAELARESCSPKFPNEDAFCLFPMRPLTRRLVHALKYRNIPGLASYLVRRSSAVKNGLVGQELMMFAQPLYFVPVPLHYARYRERGYNQAELLAAALATATSGKVCRSHQRTGDRDYRSREAGTEHYASGTFCRYLRQGHYPHGWRFSVARS